MPNTEKERSGEISPENSELLDRLEASRKFPITAVIFDFDGLLGDTETPWFTAYREACMPYGVTLEDSHWRNLMGTGKLTVAVIRLFSLPEDEEENLRQHARAAFRQFTKAGIQPMSGALELVAQLRQRYPLAIASGTPTDFLEAQLNQWNIRDAFAAVVGGEQVTNGKPAPDIFLEAARRLNAQPSACLVLEDSLHGVQAAKGANMRCIAVPHQFIADRDFSLADLRVSNLSLIDQDTIDTLERINPRASD